MEQQTSRVLSSSKRWQFPIAIEQYDRRPALTESEKEALACFVRHFTGRMRSWPAETKSPLHRLVQPLQDVLDVVHLAAKYRATPLAVILQEMHERGVAYWAWSEEQWQDILQPNFQVFHERYPTFTDQTVRLELLAIGYFLCPLTDLSSSLLRSVQPVPLARRLFGSELLEQAVERIYQVIMSWGYNTGNHKAELTQAIAEAFLANRSPYLEDLTFSLLAELAGKTRWHLRHSLGRLSRALEYLGLIDGSLPRTAIQPDITGRMNTEGIAPEWVEWCIRWYRFSGLATRTKNNYVHVLLRTGRWLALVHPDITTPHQWTSQLAAEYIASLDEIRVGDFVDAEHTKTILPRAFGKPLSARSKDRHFAIMRAFFKDLQDEPHLIPRRFDPVRLFRTPRAIRNQISANPRDLSPLLWAKLVHAALHLTEEDLPRIGGKEANRGLRYPLALVRAVAAVWVYSGLRCDEIVRLPLGCIRWQHEDVTIPETGEVLPKEATCFLTVPVNKTTSSFQKPVNPIVGKRIQEWEQVRSAGQPPQTDRKTGASVNYLFAHRGSTIGTGYLNHSLIPMLCARAGIPPADERGAITSHRARATIATLLYNAPEGLTIFELMQWLGHKDPKTTQHYARVKPTKLAAAYSKAERNSRLVEVLVDTKANTNGEVNVYYVLGDHGLCGNPDWATCLYRMACIKCPFFVPKDQAQLIADRTTVKRFLEIVELTDEELAAVQEDLDKLEAAVERTQHLRAPTLLRRQAKGTKTRGIPLTVFNSPHMFQEGGDYVIGD